MSLLGMGNPLLDISANVGDDVVEKYGVAKGTAVLAEEKHMPVYDELTKTEGVDYVAGGATLNSIRVAKLMMQDKGAAAYIGCISNDAFGKTLAEKTVGSGVSPLFMTDESTPTGTCAVLVTPDKERTLIANLSAANNYKMAHYEEEAQQAAVKGATVMYSAGFFLTVCTDAMLAAAKTAGETGAKYCMNLSAPFLMQVPPLFGMMKTVLPLCDYVFGNETEAATLAQVMEWGDISVAEIAKKLQAEDGKEGKIVVITQGADPTVVATKDGVTEYPVIKCDNLVDTNGAGDAFVGGFLSGVVQGLDIAASCKLGAYAANVVIQRAGCTFPDTAPEL